MRSVPYAPYVALVAFGGLTLWNLNRHDDLRARAMFAAFAVTAVALMTLQIRVAGRRSATLTRPIIRLDRRCSPRRDVCTNARIRTGCASSTRR